MYVFGGEKERDEAGMFQDFVSEIERLDVREGIEWEIVRIFFYSILLDRIESKCQN